MTPILLLMGGAILVWIGLTDSIVTVLDISGKYEDTSGYPKIQFLPYALASVLVTTPLAIIPNSSRWAWKYVFLILLMASVTNYNGMAKFLTDLQKFNVNGD